MKKIYFLIFLQSLICNLQSSFAQAGQWVWLHGTGSNSYSSGNLGVQGVPSPLNDPPALYEPCEWTDLNGKLWMYGGLGDGSGDSINNNLWMYDPADSEWTWVNGTDAYDDPGNYGVQGVASPANRPPSLGWGVTSWVDLSGNLWMFGGATNDFDTTTRSDLWKYDIGTNVWTWVNGPGTNIPTGIYGTQGVPDPANYPPPRTECATGWVDKEGDLWLFGGRLAQMYNDLWRYNIASNTWTWMKGSITTNQNGVWGTMGVEDPANVPSARWIHCHWVDNSGNLWMYGGGGWDASPTPTFWELSDLWRYNPCTNNWTWMNGQNVGSAINLGVFGTKCVTASSNQPPPRLENRAAWTDANGNFWMFGGTFSSTPFSSYFLNDLWKYCVSSNEWTWENGNTTFVSDPPGNWGTMNVASPTNVPSGRDGSVGWTDHKGHLYLFGGLGGSNDFWEFTIDSTCGSSCATIASISPVASFQSSDTVVCSNTCINFTSLSTGATSWKWSFQGGIPDTSTSENPPGICYNSTGNYDVTLIVASSCYASDTLKVNNFIRVFASPPTPVITCSNDTLFSSFDSSYTSYQWFINSALISGATKPYYVISQNGNYNLEVKNNKGCSIAVGITTTGCLTDVINFSEDHSIFIYPNPATDQLFVTGYPLTGKSVITVFNVLGETIYKEELNRKQEIINCKTFSSGVYFVQIANENGRWGGRFVKE